MDIRIKTEFIKLDQLLKFSGVVGSGSDAKDMILSEKVTLNGEITTQRGRKIYPGDTVEINTEVIKVLRD